MIYQNLGNSGLQVSALSFGTWTNLDTSYQQLKKLIQVCLNKGVNFFDLAESYGQGLTDERIGQIFQQLGTQRESIVISTKIWKGKDPYINSSGNTNKKHVKQGLTQSLKRLRMDYVDIVIAHKYDEFTPLEEICRAFNQVIQDGLAFYWGVSNWPAHKIYEAFEICQKNKWHLPITAQNQYNMLCRKEIESEFRTLFQKYNFGLVAYSPLMGGYLTGKYLDNQNSSGRFTDSQTSHYSKDDLRLIYMTGLDIQKINEGLRQIQKIAQKQLDCTLAQLAIAWTLKFKYTSTALFGARNQKQLLNTIDSLKVLNRLDDKIEGRINHLLQTQPQARMYWQTFSSEKHLRPISQQ